MSCITFPIWRSLVDRLNKTYRIGRCQIRKLAFQGTMRTQRHSFPTWLVAAYKPGAAYAASHHIRYYTVEGRLLQQGSFEVVLAIVAHHLPRALTLTMTSQARATSLTKLNIHAIFGEKDATQRLQTISKTWVTSGEALFVDSLGVFKTHEEISAMADKIQGFGGPEDEFVELSE